MYRIVHGSTHDLPDVERFIETLNALDRNARQEGQLFFDYQRELVVGRAPGRLDVMGGIADYSGSLVLQMPIREATFAAVQIEPARKLTILSLSEDCDQRHSLVEIQLDDFESAGVPIDYDSARELLGREPNKSWAAYVAGVFLVLMRELGVRFKHGARILIASQVPEGKGVSSSAALEVAVMQAITAAFEIAVPPREAAILCQMVENKIVGAPCGVMDQMTACCGEVDRLLALLCQPAELIGTLAIPSDLAFWGIDSGVRHSVAGSDYASVRAGAFMGYRIIADIATLEVRDDANGVSVSDARWQGYLANLTPSEFEAVSLPESYDGAQFLSRYGGTTDPITRIDPERVYQVRVAAAHPVYEHHRARLFSELMSSTQDEQRLQAMGELMYQSHESYSACGLGSAGTDLLVELVREAGPRSGLFGARITGGGSGGTVAVLGRRDAGESIRLVAATYAERTGRKPVVFSGSSPGAAEFGFLKLRRDH